MPESTPPENSGSGTGTPPEGNTPPTPPEAPKPVTFASQEELDRLIADRVRRAKPADYDELVKLREERDAAAEAEKTELEKERDARKAAEKETKAREAKANLKLIRAEVLSEATAQNALDNDIVAALLAGSKDITVDDDGEVLGAKEAVAKLLADKPVLVRGKSSSSGGEFGGNDPKTVVAKIAELEAKMNNSSLPWAERQAAGAEARALKMSQIA